MAKRGACTGVEAVDVERLLHSGEIRSFGKALPENHEISKLCTARENEL